VDRNLKLKRKNNMVAPLRIEGGITIGGGIGIGPGIIPPKDASLVLNLDAANYSAIPVDGTTIDGTGSYTITTLNPGGSMSWDPADGGIFRKTTSADTDFLTFGPDYSVTSDPYTVMMVYRSQPATPGRLLNANTASPDWLLGLWGSGGGVQNVFYNGNFVGSTVPTDNNYQFIWATYNGNPGSPVSQSYVANSTVPTTTYGTETSNGGFNGLRLFGRFLNSTTSSEVVTADVGLVKVWDGVLSLLQIQAQWNAYKTRFGY
jgi:hypothetical protein